MTAAEQLVEVNGTFSVGPPKSRRPPDGHPPAAVVAALAEHLADYTAESPDAFVSSAPRADICGAATPTAGTGSRHPSGRR